jgi:hypothetical protein
MFLRCYSYPFPFRLRARLHTIGFLFLADVTARHSGPYMSLYIKKRSLVFLGETLGCGGESSLI